MPRGKGGQLYDDDDFDDGWDDEEEGAWDDYDDPVAAAPPVKQAGSKTPQTGGKAAAAAAPVKSPASTAGAAAAAAKREPSAAAAKQAAFPLVPPAAVAAQQQAAAAAAAGRAAGAGGSSSSEGTLEMRQPFGFNSPSPDDIVLAAQQGRPIVSSQQPASQGGVKKQLPGVPGLPQSKFLSQPTPLQQQQQLQQRQQQDASSASGAAAAGLTAGVGGLVLGPGGASGSAATGAGAGAIRLQQRRRIGEYEMEPELARECAELSAAEARQVHADSDGPRPGLHLVVLGHVDAGKSTLMGRLLYEVGAVSSKEAQKNQREAAQAGKASFAWAWALDERPEERARGVTVDVAMQRFKTSRYNVTLLDAPGHRDFVPNAIAGAAQADAALLLVDGSPGGFEAGFEGTGGEQSGGQTKEHAQLARSLGIEQLAVVVSKLDTCGFSQQRFLDIQAVLLPFLKTSGFKESLIQWLPAVGPSGQNLVSPPSEPELAKWWEGPTVIGAVDNFTPRDRATGKPFRLPISDVSKPKIGAGAGGSVLLGGKLEAGALRVGSKVVVVPGGEAGTVKAIEVDGQSAKVARAGDSVELSVSGIDAANVLQGSVLCPPDFPAPLVTRFEARVVVLDAPIPLLRGANVTLHAHSAREEGHISALVSAINPKTGEPLKAKPRCLVRGQTAVVEVTAARSLVLEEYADYKALGRVALREGGRTVAVGVVTQLLA